MLARLLRRTPRGSARTLARVGLALLLLNVLWRVIRFGLVFPLWGDEARVAVNLFDRSLAELAQPLDYLQIVPYLFLAAESLITRVLGLGEVALRALPVAAGIASAVLVWRLARATLDRRSAVAATALLAASYYPVRHATEVKPYSLDLLFGAALLLLGWRLLEGRGRWSVFAIVATVAVWASYPAVFVVGGVVLVLAWQARGDRHRLLRVLAASVVPTLGFASMWILVGRTQAAAGSFLLEHDHWTQSFPPTAEPWRIPLWLVQAHAGNLFAYPNGGNHFGSSATLLLVVAGAVTLWRTKRRVLLALLLSPFPLMLLAALLGRYPYGGSARIAQHLVPSICLLAGTGVVGGAAFLLGPRRVALALRAWVVAMVLFAVGGIVRDVRKPYKHAFNAEIRRAVNALGSDKAPDDRWIVFGSLEESDRAPTLPRVAGWRGWGGDWATMHYYILRSAPPDLEWAPAPGGVEAGPRTLLLAYRDNAHEFPEALYERYVRALEERLGPPVLRETRPLRPGTPMALELRGWASVSR